MRGHILGVRSRYWGDFDVEKEGRPRYSACEGEVDSGESLIAGRVGGGAVWVQWEGGVDFWSIAYCCEKRIYS